MAKADTKILQSALDALVLHDNNKQSAADSLGMARSTYRDLLNRAIKEGLRPTVLPADAEARVTELTIKHSQEVRDLRRQLKASVEDNISAEVVRQSIYELLDHDPTPPDWAISTTVKQEGPGTPTLFLSDWHYGEKVDKSEMAGLNEYNIEIADRRWHNVVNKTVDLCKNHMVNPKYQGFVLALGGDMISGEIHEELSETNEGYNMEHVFRVFDNLVWTIDILIEQFGKVFIPCAFGNHGRNGKWRFKGAAPSNYDWQLYCWLERHYKNNPAIKFSVPSSYDTVYILHGTTYVLTHGDRLGVRGGDGVIGILGPVARGIKKLKAVYEAQQQHVDYVIMGHWHQRTRLQDGIVNGSGKGYDEFALGHRFNPEPPQQCLWFTHPRYGITFEIPIFADEPAEKSKKWIEVFDG